MFHKTAIRLTGLYLIIIMTISFFFSGLLYVVSSQELTRNVQRQESFIDQLPPRNRLPQDFGRQLAENRIELAESAKARILFNIFLTNILVLVIGGAVSFILAKKSLEPIEEAHQSLERFTADASHELRTPIAAMKSEIEVALMQKTLRSKDAQAVLRSNLEELDNLTRLTGGLLSIARQEEAQVDVSSLAVSKILQTVVEKMKPLADAKTIQCVVDTDTKLKVLADRAALQETLVIVLENAIKYSPEKSTITLRAKKSGSQMLIEVSDEGPGIAPTDIPYIFDRFYRSDAARSKSAGEGHGLGLSIARQLIEKQGGTITAKSKLKNGTTIRILLPTPK